MSGSSVPIEVLHVDDEPDFGDLVATFLEEEDERIAVTTASSANEGLDRLEEHAIDCIVSDYDMPGRNGIEFLEAVREYHPTLPFILFTGKGSEEVASDAISSGVTDYLQKEGGTDQYTVLANRITNAVAQFRAEKRLRQRERELERQTQRFAALFKNFPEPTVGYAYRDGVPYIEVVNEAFTEVFGYETEEAVGEPVDEMIVPDDRSEEARQVDERVKAGDVLDVTLRRKTADGEGDFWFRNIPLADDDHLDGFGVYADVTDRERRKRRLERYEKIVEASGDPVYTLDQDGYLTFVNDAFVEMSGYDKSELVGAHASHILDEADVGRAEQLIQSLLSSEATRDTLEAELVRADGTRIPCEAQITLLPFETEFRGTVGVVRDISERKRRERQLRQERD